jgi:hypothetical protein
VGFPFWPDSSLRHVRWIVVTSGKGTSSATLSTIAIKGKLQSGGNGLAALRQSRFDFNLYGHRFTPHLQHNA